MRDFRWYTLGELSESHNAARRPIKASARLAGSTPYYGASGVVDWVEGFTHEGEFLLVSEDGENLRSRSTPIAFNASGRIWVNNHAHVLTGRFPADTKFLSYALACADISGYLTGSAQPKLSKAALDSIRLWLPDVAGRKAIADVLGALDDKIAANGRSCDLLSQLSKAVFRQAVAGGSAVAVSDVASLVTRGIAPKYVESDGVVVLNQKCIRDQIINIAPARLTEVFTKRTDKMLMRNDVLVNSTGQGTLGRAARWLHPIEATVDSHITIVRFDSSLVDPVCAGYALVQLESQIEGLAEGSTGQTELRRDLVAALSLEVPQGAHQRAVSERLTSLDDCAMQLRVESERLAATRDELLPLLMSGRVRVRHAENVVEEVV